jgi:hypothetical protein
MSSIEISVSQFRIIASVPLEKCIGPMEVILTCLPDGNVVSGADGREHPAHHKPTTTNAMKMYRGISSLT